MEEVEERFVEKGSTGKRICRNGYLEGHADQKDNRRWPEVEGRRL